MDRDDRRRAAGALCIDARTRSVMYRGMSVELTATEFRILELLNSHPGWVLSAVEIADACLECGGSYESVVVHMSNLRGKLARATAGPTPIETVRGFGYRLSHDSSGVLSTTGPADSGETLGDTLIASGSLANAADAYLQALDSADEANEQAMARLHLKAAQVAAERRLLMEAMGHCSDAEKILRAGNPDVNRELLDDVRVQRAWLTYYMGEFANAHGQCVDLLRRLDDAGTPDQRVKLHGCALMCLLAMHRFVVTADTLRHAWSMYDAWEDTSDLAGALYVESLLGTTLMYSGNLTAGEQRLKDALRMSEELGDRAIRPHILESLGIAARWRGEVRLAETIGTQLLSDTDEIERPESAGVGHGLLCWVAWRDGKSDTAADQGQAAQRDLQRVPVFPFWWLVLGPLIAIAVNDGQVDDAIGYARHLLDPSQQALPFRLGEALAEACTAWEAGQDPEARAALSRAVVTGRAEGYT